MCASSRGKVAGVAQAADDNVTVTVEDAIRGEKLHLDYDMVVLATGMQPSLTTDSLLRPCPWTKTVSSWAVKRLAFLPPVAPACRWT